MKRRYFLKLFAGAVAGLSLGFRPRRGQAAEGREAVPVYKAHLRGLAYYDYAAVKDRLRPGDALRLVREPDNPYDADAIAVFYGPHRLGYLPAVENIVLARMMDRGLKLTAVVTEHSGRPYREVEAEIFLWPGARGETVETNDTHPSRSAAMAKLNDQNEGWPSVDDHPHTFPYC